MDNVWMILVMLTGIIGLIIYAFTRPQGNLVPRPQCANKRLQVSAKCPHCHPATYLAILALLVPAAYVDSLQPSIVS